jgi:hypothetical protein
MLKGVHLTLMIGPMVPIPVPVEVAEAISSVEVTNSKERSGFQISFSAGSNSKILNSLLPSGYFDPITTRVIIIVTMNGTPHVLADGLITKQEVSPSSEAGKSSLVITGEDLSVAMDILNRTMPYPALNITAKVFAILGPYAALGIVPLVIPPILDPPSSPTERHETQRSTDRAYIKKLAKDVGYVFFIQPGPLPGQSIAYFGPDANLPVPQPAVSINMDAHTSVESLNFSLDGLAKKLRIFTIMDPVTKKIPIPVPLPNINAFKPPLGKKPAFPAGLEFDDSSARLGPVDAAKKVLGYLMNNSASISGNGSLDVMRHKHILKARMLVGVRGAGLAYDGLYYVDSVTHNIKPGEYKQSFTLSRDGIISNTSNVAI